MPQIRVPSFRRLARPVPAGCEGREAGRHALRPLLTTVTDVATRAIAPGMFADASHPRDEPSLPSLCASISWPSKEDGPDCPRLAVLPPQQATDSTKMWNGLPPVCVQGGGTEPPRWASFELPLILRGGPPPARCYVRTVIRSRFSRRETCLAFTGWRNCRKKHLPDRYRLATRSFLPGPAWERENGSQEVIAG